ncbi:hypothetical protein ACVIWV_003071 [Bradyrhizobium diazoefficiens]|jgi:hypothetical protein
MRERVTLDGASIPKSAKRDDEVREALKRITGASARSPRVACNFTLQHSVSITDGSSQADQLGGL